MIGITCEPSFSLLGHEDRALKPHPHCCAEGCVLFIQNVFKLNTKFDTAPHWVLNNKPAKFGVDQTNSSLDI